MATACLFITPIIAVILIIYFGGKDNAFPLTPQEFCKKNITFGLKISKNTGFIIAKKK
jgi:hypothetical protein